MSEDCLTLNVWTPASRAQDGAPVMVWIHGGGLFSGSGTAALYDGTALARRGVVVVTINYRLGRFGFFGHPALSAEAVDEDVTGNYGLADIIAALEWVRDNIRSFNGDPGLITVFGQSAGGAMIARLMTSSRAQGLFHRAIIQSGLGRDPGVVLSGARDGSLSLEARGMAFARAAGLAADAPAAQLRALAAERLLVPPPSFYEGDLTVIDAPNGGGLVEGDVAPAFAAGRSAPVPLIIGTNSAEFRGTRPSQLPPFGDLIAGLTLDERLALHAAYGGEEAFEAGVLDDLIFNEPARHLARLHAAHGHPTYLYRFDATSDPGGGAMHGAERACVFDNPPSTGGAAQDRETARLMADYWTGFAALGDPNGPDRPDWPAFGAESGRLLTFTSGGAIAGPVPFAARLDRVEALQDRIRDQRARRISSSANSAVR